MNFNKFLLLDIDAEEESEENEIQTFSVSEALLLRHKLKGLYSLLSQHPALLYRRLQVGSQRPSYPSSDTLEVFICQSCYNINFSESQFHQPSEAQEAQKFNQLHIVILQSKLQTILAHNPWHKRCSTNVHILAGRKEKSSIGYSSACLSIHLPV